MTAQSIDFQSLTATYAPDFSIFVEISLKKPQLKGSKTGLLAGKWGKCQVQETLPSKSLYTVCTT